MSEGRWPEPSLSRHHHSRDSFRVSALSVRRPGNDLPSTTALKSANCFSVSSVRRRRNSKTEVGACRPRLLRCCPRTKSNPQAADCQPIIRRAGAHQRHKHRGSVCQLPETSRPDLRRGHRRRSCFLVQRRIFSQCRRRNYQRSASWPSYFGRPADHRVEPLRQARRFI
jgi:hypothetical protein